MSCLDISFNRKILVAPHTMFMLICRYLQFKTVQLTEAGVTSHHGRPARLIAEEEDRLEPDRVPILPRLMEEMTVQENLLKVSPATTNHVQVSLCNVNVLTLSAICLFLFIWG